MTVSPRMFALVALCVSALSSISASHAATITITGSPFGTDGIGAFPGYGTAIQKNNVVNFFPSRLFDLTFTGTPWRLEGNTTPGVVLSNVPKYEIDWYFSGAESGYVNTLVSGPVSFSEGNQNNRYNLGNDPGFQFLGTSTGSGVNAPISFSVLANNGADITNGDNNKPGQYIASLMFAYVKPKYHDGSLTAWFLTTEPTDWFAFGFDDDGSVNDDHDDFMGVAYVRAVPVPLPGAALLFSTGVALLGLFRWARSRMTAVA
jgi:hypothetical protein